MFFNNVILMIELSLDLLCLFYPILWILNKILKKILLPGMTFIGPHIIGSNYLSSFIIGSRGSLNTHKGRAKLIVTFL